MDEEVKIDDGISEWEASLPSAHDLTPLSQSLIPAEFATAFRISPEPSRTAVDVGHASRSTLSSIHGGASLEPFGGHVMEEAETDPKKSRRTDAVDEKAAKTLKRPRLVWTPQLHRRFVDVVAHLGLKNAVPKTIMQLMNVEGLTRENVASHLQKYRLYVKRMQGLSNEGASPSDHLFASTPLPPHESSIGNGNGSSGNNEGGIMVGYESAHYQRQYQQIDCSPNTFHGYPHHSII